MKSKKLLAYIFTFVLALGTMVIFISTGQNSNFIRNEAYETPMRIDLSYENKQLTNDAHSTGTYYYVDVKTYRNNTIRLLQDGISYLDDVKKVRLGLDGWFGNLMEKSGIERDPINGLTKIHFENGNNLKVKYGWSATVQSPREEIPDEHGDVYFDGLKPSYFQVTIDNGEQATFSSCEIYYDCVGTSSPTAVTATNVHLRQSHYDATPGDLYVYDDPEASWASHLENNDYFYAKVGTSYKELDKHEMFMLFDFNKPIAGKTHFEGVRLDDQFVTDFNIEALDDKTTVQYGEQTLRVSFKYKGFGTISNHSFKVVGYYRKDVGHSIVSIDNIKQQADNTLPGENIVTVQSLVTFIAFAKHDPFSLGVAQIHIAHTIFTREIKFKDLNNLNLDSNAFTEVGEHKLSFSLDCRYPLHGTYLVYNESNYIKSVSFNGFKEQIEPGEDLSSYFDSGVAYVNLNYQDGTSNKVIIDSSNVDLSLVNTKVEGTYSYYVDVEGYKRVQRYVSVVISGIGDETGADIYAPTESTENNVYAYGVDSFGTLTKFYISSIVAKDNKYRATCHLEQEETTFERFGTYAIDEFGSEKQIILFGQLWASRIKFVSTNNEKEYALISHAEIESDEHYDDVIYTPDEDTYNMFDGIPFHFFSSPYNEIRIDMSNELKYRTTCTYLNEEKTRISFQFPFMSIVITFEATIYENDRGKKMINVEPPAYLTEI